MAERPDVIALSCLAGGYDRASFEAGYRLRGLLDLIGLAAPMQGVTQLVVPTPLVPAMQALAEFAGGRISAPDEEHDTAEAALVLLEFDR